MESVCIGVDVGGTNLRCALVTREGVVLSRQTQPTEVAAGGSSFFARLLAVLDRLQAEAAREGRQVVSVGVGVPGLVSNQGVLRCSVNLAPLQGLNFRELISAGSGTPVEVLNDANASALGEHRFGAGRGYRSTVLFSIGTGVGGGVILDGRLWTGVDGSAGELGHLTVEPKGRSCGCGNRGCLEQYSSATAIAAALAGSAEAGELGAAAGAVRARRGEARALAVFQEAGRYLGIAAAGIVNLLNVEAILVGGGVAESFDLLAEPMRREIASRALGIPAGTVRVLQGELGDDAGVLGAAAAAFETLERAPAGASEVRSGSFFAP